MCCNGHKSKTFHSDNIQPTKRHVPTLNGFFSVLSFCCSNILVGTVAVYCRLHYDANVIEIDQHLPLL